ncbi:MFS transporter [Rhodoferax sp.]|uniref:MFS transporter n=1 Tax=Rhodoferax sp. TaxID=50421 RepID=UPI00374D5FC6
MSLLSNSSIPVASRLPANVAFPVLALVLFAFFLAAAAPSPMFVVMQRAWGFSPTLLTVAFAIYALALLLSLLVAGSLSDHVGRRPVMFAALVLQAGAMLLFVLADGIGGLIAARALQGMATGIASGALTAAVMEAAPAQRKPLGALITSVSPLAGLALGALLSGVVIALVAQPAPWVFGGLALLFALGALVVLYVPETVSPRPGAWASLVPRISIPKAARVVFARSVPALVTGWALGGLYLALAPSILRQVFHTGNGVVSGLVIAVLSGVGALASVLLKRFVPARGVQIGLASMLVGLLLVLLALSTQSLALFFIATAVAGVGFGGAFSAVVQALAPLAQAHERSELFAALFVVSYLAFSLPTMAAGLLVAPLGLLATVQGYVGLLLVTGLAGLWLQLRATQQPALTQGQPA